VTIGTGSGTSPAPSVTSPDPASGTAAGAAPGGLGGGTPSTRPGGSGSPSGAPTGGAPQTPASLAVTALGTADTGERWCQRVTLGIANSGDRTATSGTVTFSTHVVGALGVDWWTYRTSQSLAAPVPGHVSVSESWTVCLDAWRVPAGTHLGTRSATLG
jgi:hypothetical protein